MEAHIIRLFTIFAAVSIILFTTINAKNQTWFEPTAKTTTNTDEYTPTDKQRPDASKREKTRENQSRQQPRPTRVR